MVSAHRIAYTIANPEWDTSYTIDHLCKNVICQNPAHMEAVSLEENTRRAHTQTHCKRGHEMIESNLYWFWNKRTGIFVRACKQCSHWNRDKK